MPLIVPQANPPSPLVTSHSRSLAVSADPQISGPSLTTIGALITPCGNLLDLWVAASARYIAPRPPGCHFRGEPGSPARAALACAGWCSRPAVDRDRRAVNHARLLRAEKKDHLRDLLRLGPACVIRRGHGLPVCGSVENTRYDRIDGNGIRLDFRRQRIE